MKYRLKVIGAWIVMTLFIGGMLGGSMRAQAAFVWGGVITTVIFLTIHYWPKWTK